eukprot:1618003-Heterocapsa_arctica.AAC.1
MNDPTDVEKWRGADAWHPKDDRRPPLVWEGDFVTSFKPDPDGHASYGRVNWHGTRGVVPTTIFWSNATRIHTYTDAVSENVGNHSE